MPDPQTTPELIERKLLDKATELLDSTRFAIAVAFRDPKYQQLIWLAVIQKAKEYALAAEQEANVKA